MTAKIYYKSKGKMIVVERDYVADEYYCSFENSDLTLPYPTNYFILKINNVWRGILFNEEFKKPMLMDLKSKY
jgi:hypothetical protein